MGRDILREVGRRAKHARSPVRIGFRLRRWPRAIGPLLSSASDRLQSRQVPPRRCSKSAGGAAALRQFAGRSLSAAGPPLARLPDHAPSLRAPATKPPKRPRPVHPPASNSPKPPPAGAPGRLSPAPGARVASSPTSYATRIGPGRTAARTPLPQNRPARRSASSTYVPLAAGSMNGATPGDLRHPPTPAAGTLCLFILLCLRGPRRLR